MPAETPIPAAVYDEAWRELRSASGPLAFAAAVRVVYAAGVAAGRTQRDTYLIDTFDRIAASERQSLVSTPPEYVEDQMRYRARAVAFERCAEIIRETAAESPSKEDTPRLPLHPGGVVSALIPEIALRLDSDECVLLTGSSPRCCRPQHAGRPCQVTDENPEDTPDA